VRREAPGASEGGISARVSGAHPRGNPPGDGRSQNGARHDNRGNPKTCVSAQDRPGQHKDDNGPEQIM